MRIRVQSDEVWYGEGPSVSVTAQELEALKAQAARNPRRRARLCAHATLEDAVHEMVVVHTRETYVRPHMHLGRGESFHVIEGVADAVGFDEDGRVTWALRLGVAGSGLPFFHRAGEPGFHTVLVRSAWFVFHETTRGPFRPEGSVFAPWAPEGPAGEEVQAYLAGLERAVDQLLGDVPTCGAVHGARA